MSSIATLLDTQSTTTYPYDQPLTSPPIMLTEKAEYDASCFKYEKLADMKIRNSESIVLGGYSVMVKVRNGSLVVEKNQALNSKILAFQKLFIPLEGIAILVRAGAVEWGGGDPCGRPGELAPVRFLVR